MVQARQSVLARQSFRRPTTAALLATILLLGLAACSTVHRGGGIERGVASWYGPGFHGKRTANGEVYDQEELTAAHRQLPFGTRVRVVNLDNGRSVEVRINDRGPFAHRRIIDLSRAAADAIDMIGPGTALVRLEILYQPVATGFIVQAGAFSVSARAMALLAELEPAHPEAAIYSDGQWHRVQIGPFATRQAAKRVARSLQARGIETLVRSSG